MEIDSLIRDLSAADVALRRAAAEALSREGAVGAAVPLVRASADPDERVQESAHAALEGMGPPPLEVGSQLAELLPQEGSAGYWSATLLGRLRADAAAWAGHLGDAVQKNADASVRQRAAWALGQMGPPAAAALPALQEAAQSKDARLARLAADALGRLGE